MRSELLMDKEDIQFVPIVQELCEHCSEKFPTQEVRLDIRSLGMNILVGNFCDDCAKETKNRIAEGLYVPEDISIAARGYWKGEGSDQKLWWTICDGKEFDDISDYDLRLKISNSRREKGETEYMDAVIRHRDTLHYWKNCRTSKEAKP